MNRAQRTAFILLGALGLAACVALLLTQDIWRAIVAFAIGAVLLDYAVTGD